MTNEKKDDNTIFAKHIKKEDKENIVLGSKEYQWHIPKVLRGTIRVGDKVLVQSKGKIQTVVVTKLIREDIELTNKKYKMVRYVLPNLFVVTNVRATTFFRSTGATLTLKK